MTTPAPTTPPRLYPANAYQLTLNLTHEGQAAVVVLGAKTNGTFLVESDLQQWKNHAWDTFKGLVSSDVSCTGAIGRSVSSAGGTVWELGPPTTPAGQGDSASNAVAAAAVLIKWSTATGGRSGKGRTFLPGLAQINVQSDGRSYTTAFQTLANNKAAAYINGAVFSASIKPAVLSFTKGEAYQITSGALSPRIGLQRRRMR